MIDNERMPLSHQANRHRYNENNDYDLFEAGDIKERDDDRFLKSKFVYQLKPNIKQYIDIYGGVSQMLHSCYSTDSTG